MCFEWSKGRISIIQLGDVIWAKHWISYCVTICNLNRCTLSGVLYMDYLIYYSKIVLGITIHPPIPHIGKWGIERPSMLPEGTELIRGRAGTWIQTFRFQNCLSNHFLFSHFLTLGMLGCLLKLDRRKDSLKSNTLSLNKTLKIKTKSEVYKTRFCLNYYFIFYNQDGR